MQNNFVRNYQTIQPNLLSSENKNLSPEVHLARDRYVYGSPILASNYEDQGNNGIRSYNHDDTIDPRFSQLNQANNEIEQPHEEDMEIGFGDSPPPPTYEGLEQRLIDEVMTLVRERNDAEDAEFARHEERMLEINREYMEKLYTLRAQQATRREEFLHQESQARLNEYQKGKRNQYLHMKVPDSSSYMLPQTFTTGESNSRLHGREQTQYFSSGSSSQKSEERVRVPLPPGRVYNNNGLYHPT